MLLKEVSELVAIMRTTIDRKTGKEISSTIESKVNMTEDEYYEKLAGILTNDKGLQRIISGKTSEGAS